MLNMRFHKYLFSRKSNTFRLKTLTSLTPISNRNHMRLKVQCRQNLPFFHFYDIFSLVRRSVGIRTYGVLNVRTKHWPMSSYIKFWVFFSSSNKELCAWSKSLYIVWWNYYHHNTNLTKTCVVDHSNCFTPGNKWWDLNQRPAKFWVKLVAP